MAYAACPLSDLAALNVNKRSSTGMTSRRMLEITVAVPGTQLLTDREYQLADTHSSMQDTLHTFRVAVQLPIAYALMQLISIETISGCLQLRYSAK